MKTTLHIRLSIAIFLFSNLAVQAQPDRTVYAVTDSVMNGTKWNFLRSLDLRTKTYSGILLRLLNGNDTLPVNSLCNGVAAIAHDRKNKRLYFTPMLIDRLSYVDLRTMQIHTVTNNFAGTGPKKPDQSNIITRMTIGDDDRGYALTNDGRQLIRFSTRHHNNITNLGSLVDAPGNEVSVHSACESYGGDIIPDDEGNLYLVTINNSVFRIDIHTRVARYRGGVRNLPEGFTTNGIAVDERNNRLVIVSAVDASDLYSFPLRTLFARELNMQNSRLTADLANSSVLKKHNRHDDDDDRDEEDRGNMLVDDNSEMNNHTIQLYPNPVTSDEFRIAFRNMDAGAYTVDVLDVNGKTAISSRINTSGKNSITVLAMPKSAARGLYVVRIADRDGKIVYNGKMILQ